MKCPKCGKEVNKEDKFCNECGELLVTDVTPAKKEEVKETKTEEVEEKRIISSMGNDTFFCLCSLACYFGGPLLTALFTKLSEYTKLFSLFGRITMLLPLAAYGLAIYAKVKYPKSTFAKVLLIVYIAMFVLAIIGLILIVIACAAMLRDCGNQAEGCSQMGYIFSLLFQ